LIEDSEDVAFALGDYLAEFHAKRVERFGQHDLGELLDFSENFGSEVGLSLALEGVAATTAQA
jgi:hypothetical protein